MENNNQFDSLSYALGLSMGNNFRASGIEKINVQDFADGVAAVFYGSQPKMSYDEAKAEIQKFFTELEAKQQKAAAAMAEVNEKAGNEFLAENGKRAEVQTTP
ncbi:MAG: FKBP-type peptidyl-prolyl cis-trans isomerase N-terminal domain-containing protein, partial [Muribaculaceae bacterium]|nr:FKBP-type peptidyl-prolyl cis-trans isomerase N-terminal domain-containing protein [Muribaculaceae bacterium]